LLASGVTCRSSRWFPWLVAAIQADFSDVGQQYLLFCIGCCAGFSELSKKHFCGFRKAQDERGEDAVDRDAWLDARRKALHSRMRNRRRRERERRRSSSGGGSRRSPFSLF